MCAAQQRRGTIALGCPQHPAILQQLQVVVQVDPCIRGFGQHLLPTCVRVPAQRQPPLVSGLRLHEQRPVGREGHPRQVVVLRHRPIKPDGLAAPHIHHAQPSFNVRPTRERIALRHHANAIGVHFMAMHLRHRRLVHAHVGQLPFVWRPPMPVEAVHLLLSDEVRQAVAHRVAAVRGQPPLLVIRQGQHIEVPAPHIAHEVAVGGEAHARLSRARRRERTHVARGHVHQPRAALRREQNLVAAGMPLVGYDALRELSPPLALGAFRGRLWRCRFSASQQPPRLAPLYINQPELQPLPIVVGR